MWIAAALLTDLRGHLRRGIFGLCWFSFGSSGELYFVLQGRLRLQTGGEFRCQIHSARFVIFGGRYLELRIGRRRYGFGCFFRGRACFGWLRFRLRAFVRLL